MDNPYDVSQPSYAYRPPSSAAGSTAEYPFRPAHVLTPVLRVLYALLIPAMPMLAYVAIYAERFEQMDEAEPLTDQAMLLALVGFAFILAVVMIFFTTIIMHCMWTNRMNKNARALGAKDMEYTPGWAVGWYFVPIAHLFKPFSATSEIYRASKPGLDGVAWKNEPTPGILSFWWACWIIGNIFDRISDRVIGDAQVALIIALIAGGLSAAAAAAAFVWVGRVHRRQLETSAKLQTTTPPPTPVENW